jgi:opacity protein-like surface antigen
MKIRKLSFVLASLISPNLKGNPYNPYLGVGIGYVNGSSKISTDYSELIAHDSVKKNDMGVRGFQASIYAGIGKPCLQKSYYTGMEISADLTNAKGQDKQTVGVNPNTLNPLRNDVSLKYKHAFNAAFKGGFYLGEKALFYVKPGLSYAKWQYSAHYNQGGFARKSSYLMGGKISLGLQYALSPQLDIGVEYSYSKYKNFKLSQRTQAGEIINHRINPSINLGMINLTKKF